VNKSLFQYIQSFGLLVILSSGFAFSQTGPVKQVFNDEDLESEILYSARDSAVTDAANKQLHLYGNAYLSNDDLDMHADYIIVDYGKKDILATYTTDSLGRKVGIPVFVQEGDTITADRIRYNYELKKGFIEEVTIKQDEYYLSMEKAKRHPNGEIHFVHGKFTTCNLKEPHYHFFLSKAVLVPEKRIVSGPVNLWVMGVPTPLGLPFAIIPQKKKDDTNPAGFLMPQISVVSAYGMGFQDLGYYKPINDKLQTILYGTVFSRGSFGLRNRTDYSFKYKANGNVEVGYSQFRYGWPDSTVIGASTVKWTHNQDPKANPLWTFNANVNFNSNSTNKQTLNVQNEQYFNNTLNSDIRMGRRFAHAPVSLDGKLSMRQNSSTRQIDLTSPILNFQTTSRIYPFKNVNKVVGLTYSSEYQNRSTFHDRYLKQGDFDSINQQFRSGFNHRANAQATFNMLKGTIRFTPSVAYAQVYNFQSIRKSVNANDSLIVDSLNVGGFTHSFSSSASVTTNLFSYYRFVGKKKTLLRHVMTPTVSFTYSPDIQLGGDSYLDTSQNVIQYNRYERSIYAQGNSYNSGRIAFGLNNTFEIKQKSDKDTLTGFKKTKIIDNLFLNTDYDIFKESMRWSDLSIRLVVNPIERFSFNFNAVHSWYAWDDSTGLSNSKYAINEGQGLGRIRSASFATIFTLTSKEYQSIVQQRNSEMQNVWNPQYQTWMTNPSQMVYFDIPWRITLEHLYSLSLNSNSTPNTDVKTFQERKYLPTNTLRASGEFAITENWKITSVMLLDIGNKTLSNLNFNMYRNLHCWNVGINWTPIGTNQNFSVTLKGNAAALQNANFTIRKPPIVL
jgi:lipopolysaccharide export system protein LptA